MLKFINLYIYIFFKSKNCFLIVNELYKRCINTIDVEFDTLEKALRF